MRALAVGADLMGRWLNATPLPLTRRSEVRNAAQTFNRTQDRLNRFVVERTQMLAALSHDLRAPPTAMRLRIKMLDKTEDSVPLKVLVKDVQVMVQAKLQFVSATATTKAAVIVDLAAMPGDLAADMGCDHATLAPSAPLPATVRPQSLNQALRTLIDNAVRYVGTAQINLTHEPIFALIRVADKGSGMQQDQLKAVFEPFVPLETFRCRDTCGVGWGPAIARTILQAHGGTVQPHKRTGDGPSAIVRLPVRLPIGGA